MCTCGEAAVCGVEPGNFAVVGAKADVGANDVAVGGLHDVAAEAQAGGDEGGGGVEGGSAGGETGGVAAGFEKGRELLGVALETVVGGKEDGHGVEGGGDGAGEGVGGDVDVGEHGQGA